jgi:hypothetical protein
MQITKSQHNIVEKILRDKEGRLVRARFSVYENAGRIKARLLDFTYIEALKSAVLKIVGFTKEKAQETISFFETNYTSPLFSLTLNFTGSKPRAPTLI